MKNSNTNLGLANRQNELKSEIANLDWLYSNTSMNNESFEYYQGLKSQLAQINFLIASGNN